MAKFAQLCAGERKVRRIGRTDRQMVKAGEEQGEGAGEAGGQEGGEAVGGAGESSGGGT